MEIFPVKCKSEYREALNTFAEIFIKSSSAFTKKSHNTFYDNYRSLCLFFREENICDGNKSFSKEELGNVDLQTGSK